MISAFLSLIALSTSLYCQAEAPPQCLLPEYIDSQRTDNQVFCLASVPMYRYDAPSKLCVKFIYAGFGGTENRFKTLQECVKICGAENSLIPPSNCFLSPDPGSCNDFFPEFYYDSAEGLCKEFLFGGCEGNENRFRSIFACRETCAFN